MSDFLQQVSAAMKPQVVSQVPCPGTSTPTPIAHSTPVVRPPAPGTIPARTGPPATSRARVAFDDTTASEPARDRSRFRVVSTSPLRRLEGERSRPPTAEAEGSLRAIPQMTSAEKVQSWTEISPPPTAPPPVSLPGRVTAPVCQVIQDDNASLAESVHRLPTLPSVAQQQLLQPGQSPFDWDIAGTKYPCKDPVEQGSVIEKRLTHCEH